MAITKNIHLDDTFSFAGITGEFIEVVNYDGGSAAVVDCTNQSHTDHVKRYKAGLVEPGKLTLRFEYQGEASIIGTEGTLAGTYGGEPFSGLAICTGQKVSGGMGDGVVADYDFQLTGEAAGS